jgi:hypothetical protein
VLSIVLGILIHFSTILNAFGFVQETPEESRQSAGAAAVLAEVLVTSLVAFCTFLINYYILKPFDSSVQIKPRRILSAILVTIASVTILSDLFFAIKHLLNGEALQTRYNLIYTFRDLIVGIIVISGIYVIKTVYDRQTVKIENEKLNSEKLLGQYESLKNQMSPHFLFNSLTALRELIDQDPKDAKLYISHLSLVLRYTLSSIDAQSKSLYEELEVAESYLHLVKIRFGSSLRVETLVDERYKNYRLPPLAIQILIENAIKHNEISKKNPFTIRIETSSDQNLVITNLIQERVSKEFSTGIGLSNLSKQYQYLAGKEITISNGNNEFRVELPLLNPSDNEGVNS